MYFCCCGTYAFLKKAPAHGFASANRVYLQELQGNRHPKTHLAEEGGWGGSSHAWQRGRSGGCLQAPSPSPTAQTGVQTTFSGSKQLSARRLSSKGPWTRQPRTLYSSRLPSLLLLQGGVCTAPRPTYPGRPSGQHAEA